MLIGLGFMTTSARYVDPLPAAFGKNSILLKLVVPVVPDA